MPNLENQSQDVAESYIDKLRNTGQTPDQLICIGLDPRVESLPPQLTKGALSISDFPLYCFHLFELLKRRKFEPGAVKINPSYFLQHDTPFAEIPNLGSLAMAQILDHVKGVFPNMQIIGDFKYGDIGETAEAQKKIVFDAWKFDAVTLNPYMGWDSIKPFAQTTGKGVYILCCTSNTSSKDFQYENISKLSHGEEITHPLFVEVGYKIIEWSKNNASLSIGAVVAVDKKFENDDHQSQFKELLKDFGKANIPLLIPGIGAQGGSAKNVLAILTEAKYDLSLVRINSSRGLVQPWAPAPCPYTDAIYALNKCLQKCMDMADQLSHHQD